MIKAMKSLSAIRKSAGASCILFSSVFFFLFFVCGMSVAQTQSQGDEDASTAFDARVFQESWAENTKYSLTFHRPNYFLAMTYNDNPNDGTYRALGRDTPNNFEAKFQLSVKMLVWEDIFHNNGDLYGAYTQLSLWQIYDLSSPFRETNYEPELFLKFDTDFNVLGLRNRLFLFGVVHQSNGQGEDLSRSWNRIYVEFIASKGNFVLGLKPWFRIPESSEDDDNPDIDKYLGYGKIFGAYKWRKNVLTFSFRNNLRFEHNKGSIEVGWSYALTDKLRAYCQYFNGYGESLIDYNNNTHRIGVGLMINDWI